ncbi:MAG: DUF4382 domain-containing protein [Candidatus Zixiibacteriota bacterium]|nr:MAG: DUF4382 domain-containing protein [candidate division Zixibacteria bacterium]
MKAITCAVAALLAAGLFLLAGCSDDNPAGGEGVGQIRMYLVDAPDDIDAVLIQVEEVEVHQAGADENSGWSVINETDTTYNLLDLTNGAMAVLGDTTLAAGHYTQIRLILGADNKVVVDGDTFDLNIPSSMTSGLKLTHQFTIEANTLYELILDFDAEESIHLTGAGQYTMNPTIRVEPVTSVGAISGTVAPAEAQAEITAVMGADTLHAFADTSSGYFKLIPVPAGAWEVTVTPTQGAYLDTTIAGVQVVAQDTTELGTITLGL